MTDTVNPGSFWNRLFTTSQGVAKLSIVAVGTLIVIKVVASVLTGSLGIRADAIHSIIDLSGAIIGLIGITIANRPASQRYQYGHGKAENLAGAVIAVLIFAAAGSILYEAIMRIINGGQVEMLGIGIAVTVVAIAINVAIAWLAIRVAKRTDSIALRAQGFHMLADVWSSVAVLIGLLLVTITKLVILDAVVGIVVAFLIGKTAWDILRESVSVLMDTKLPDEDEAAIREIIAKHAGDVTCIRSLRTRKSGAERFVNLTLVMPQESTIKDAHQLCDHLEHHFKHYLSKLDVNIHVEPLQPECEDCGVNLRMSVSGTREKTVCPRENDSPSGDPDVVNRHQ
jgi:cation diffusion facilitator family transporter